MTNTLTISFHGGKSGQNNLLSYGAVLDTSGVTLDELRGFTLGPGGDGHLYVAVANRDVSQVLRFLVLLFVNYLSDRCAVGSNHNLCFLFAPSGKSQTNNVDPLRLHFTPDALTAFAIRFRGSMLKIAPLFNRYGVSHCNRFSDSVARCEGNFRRGNAYLLCECAMLCRAIDTVASENDTAGLELPIRKRDVKAAGAAA